MTNLRKQARGKPCMVRMFGCDCGGETTVLAHYRMLPYSGTEMKPPDELGAWACSHCHAVIDGRIQDRLLSRIEVRLAHAEGVMRTALERAK